MIDFFSEIASKHCLLAIRLNWFIDVSSSSLQDSAAAQLRGVYEEQVEAAIEVADLVKELLKEDNTERLLFNVTPRLKQWNKHVEESDRLFWEC